VEFWFFELVTPANVQSFHITFQNVWFVHSTEDMAVLFSQSILEHRPKSVKPPLKYQRGIIDVIILYPHGLYSFSLPGMANLFRLVCQLKSGLLFSIL
jgi:hypothetical protein